MRANQTSRHWLLSAFVSLVCFMGGAALIDAAAQTTGSSVTIQGVVSDEATKEPVAGAQVWIKDSSFGTITDDQGRYSLKYSGKYAVLCVSFFGYEDTQVELTGKNQTANIVLKEGGLSIEETVVVGYGTQKKASVVGAISSISAGNLQAPVAKISNVLGGQVAGVVSYQNNGEPGAGSTFWIRGISTFSGGTTPLCLVDGVEREMDLVDPNDIKEFSVLKDASATAIYGVRGANGVILITTHSGSESKAQISARYEAGVVSPTKIPEVANAVQFAEMVNDAYGGEYYDATAMAAFRDGSNQDFYPTVNWMDEIFKKVTTSHRANVSVSGGNSVVKYYIAGGFYNEDGLYKQDSSLDYGTGMNYSKYNFRANVDVQVEKNTTLNVNLSTIFEQKNKPGADSQQIFERALCVPATAFPIYYSTGQLAGPGAGNGDNPYALVTQKGYRQIYDNNAQALVGLTHDFGWLLEGLKANAKVSFDAYNGHHLNHVRGNVDHYANPRYAEEIDELTGEARQVLKLDQLSTGDQTLGYGKASYGNRRLYLEASLSYANSFGKHNVTGLFLFQQSSKNYVGDNAGDSQASLPYRNQGIAGRVTYDYDNRYFFEFNAGYNGSENFSPGHRFGFFPSVALGYLVSEEPWWGNLKNVVDMFKIRGSWGLVGNDNIGGNRRFVYLGTIAGGGSAVFGTNAAGHAGIREGEIANPNVGWEQAEKYDLGLDVSLFGKLKVQADIFKEYRSGIFLQRKSLPQFIGITTNPWVNIGKMNNSGFDLSADYNQRIGEVLLTAKGTFTYARNVIVEQDEALYRDLYRNSTGQAMYQNYGFVSDGLFESQEDIDSHADQSLYSPRPGDIKYVDLNNDGKITDADQRPIGWRNIPEILYGFGASVEWKGIDFSLFFQGVDHVSININNTMVRGISSSYNQLWNANVLADVYGNYWTPERTDAKYPRLVFLTDSQNNKQNSDFWMKDGSYIKLQNIELGWTLPRKWTSKMHMSGFRVYLQGQNLLTFSKFKLWDPNLSGAGGGGVYAYPTTRVLSFGVSASF